MAGEPCGPLAGCGTVDGLVTAKPPDAAFQSGCGEIRPSIECSGVDSLNRTGGAGRRALIDLSDLLATLNAAMRPGVGWVRRLYPLLISPTELVCVVLYERDLEMASLDAMRP